MRNHIGIVGWGMVVCCSLSIGAGPARADQRQPNDRRSPATVKVPHTVEVMMVDGEKTGFLHRIKPFSDERVLELVPGRHTLVARLSVILDSAYDREEFQTFASEPVTLRFRAAPNTTYRLAHQDTSELFERDMRGDAELPTESVRIWLEEVGPRSEKSASASAVNTAPGSGRKRAAPEPASDGVEQRDAPRIVAEPAGDHDRAPPDVSAEELLKLWWMNASEEERASFLRWIDARDEPAE